VCAYCAAWINKKGGLPVKRGFELKKTEVAELLGVHRNTVTNLLEKGTLAGTNVRDLLVYVRKLERDEGVTRIIERLQEMEV
jgi:excisionase family DNA binding protein